MDSCNLSYLAAERIEPAQKGNIHSGPYFSPLSSSSSGIQRELKGCSDLPALPLSLFPFIQTHDIAYGFICLMVALLAITRVLKILFGEGY